LVGLAALCFENPKRFYAHSIKNATKFGNFLCQKPHTSNARLSLQSSAEIGT
jgi:hypothetical protein